MKVLTIKQPWASLIMLGYKRFEFRSWKTNYRGELLIHAGQGIDKEAMKRLQKYIPKDMPKGKILGKAKLVDCVKMSPEFKSELLKENKDIYLKNQENKNKTIIKNDTVNNSTWYIEEAEQPENEAIAMCFRLNEEIMNGKEYEENGKYAKFRIVETPEKEAAVQMTSFININEEINDEDNESNLEDIDDLDSLIDHNSNQNHNAYKDDFYFEN